MDLAIVHELKRGGLKICDGLALGIDKELELAIRRNGDDSVGGFWNNGQEVVIGGIAALDESLQINKL